MLNKLKVQQQYFNIKMEQRIFILYIFLTLISGLIAAQSDFYTNDRQIEYLTNVLTHSNLFKKGKCENQPSYPFITIDSQKALYSGIIVCNIHARQLIATEICLKWLDSLRQQTSITDKMKFRVFYRANRMRDESRTQQGQCKRKNQNGVDLNRNFPTEFNFYKAKTDQQIYPSDRPINQPFTICLNEFIEQKRPDFFLDIHSGESAFYHQEGINEDKEILILNNINQSLPELNVSKITTLKKDGESINGHIFADLKVRKQVPYSLLFETFDGSKQAGEQADPNFCFRRFNPMTPEHLKYATQVWKNAIMSTVTQVIQALDIDNKKMT